MLSRFKYCYHHLLRFHDCIMNLEEERERGKEGVICDGLYDGCTAILYYIIVRTEADWPNRDDWSVYVLNGH